jgi:hypothetical protein
VVTRIRSIRGIRRRPERRQVGALRQRERRMADDDHHREPERDGGKGDDRGLSFRHRGASGEMPAGLVQRLGAFGGLARAEIGPDIFRE